ncbi:MAG: peptide chain release factor-like protein [Planctomycetes bacterium]|nr:peptide chain release factor-like protein [Planctomycetota bacterium]
MLNSPYDCDDVILLSSVTCEKFRSSGPGGQHAQKTNSAVRLQHKDSGIQCQVQDQRSYQHNLRQALKEIRLRLALHYRGYGQEPLFQNRKQGERLKVSKDAKDFHSLVGYIFDVLCEQNWDTHKTAEVCDLSDSQLCKFLKLNKLVLQSINLQRQHLNVYPIK